jgi:hypothetical protein
MMVFDAPAAIRNYISLLRWMASSAEGFGLRQPVAAFRVTALLSTAEDGEVIALQNTNAVRSAAGCWTESYSRL